MRATTMERHGRVRVDHYAWLRERDNPDVAAYLRAENAYARDVMAHRSRFEDALFAEITSRIRQVDSSAPVKDGDYHYYTRYEEGKEYPVYCRTWKTVTAREEVILDVNEIAAGHEFFAIGGMATSENHEWLAYAFDTRGRRLYTIRFRNLVTGEWPDDRLEHVTGDMAWANDHRTLFYGKQDPDTLRASQIFRHGLGDPPSADVPVFEEKDDAFSVTVGKTKSKRYILVSAHQTVSSEYHYLDADRPDGALSVMIPRRRFHEYEVEHCRDMFVIRTNWNAKNFRLVKTPVSHTAPSFWEDVLPHRDDVLLESVEVFRDFLVAEERRRGLVRLRVVPWSGHDGYDGHDVAFDEPVYLAALGDNPESDTSTVRYVYSSMTTPHSVYDYDVRTRIATLRKREEVLGGFLASRYAAERTWATASDGTRIPVSLVYRPDLRKPDGNPLLLYGYGSYGISVDANFSSARLSLLDRGFTFALAHVRGGEELGRDWYEGGKLLRKKTTFTDFIDCAEHLIREGRTSRERLYAMGGSAGGLLMGAALNMRPDLFHGVVAQVPFVDLLNTMLDPAIPLTTGEYDEWGDPNQQEYYEYMASYSPYDRVEKRAYPHILVTAGFHDSQVQYWEPAKWVAKLRRVKTDHNRLLLRTNMDAGHGGATGRFQRYKELAFIYAFLLDLAGLADPANPENPDDPADDQAAP